MRRHPILLGLLIVGFGIAATIIYFTAQMRMRTPPQFTVVREEWRVIGKGVPGAHLRVHYEMKNTTIFPVRVSQVALCALDSSSIGDIDAYEPKDALLLKPGHVHKGVVTLFVPEGAPGVDAQFRVRWEPKIAPMLRPLLYDLDSRRRRATGAYPADPFAPPGSPDAPLDIEEKEDMQELIHFERKAATP